MRPQLFLALECDRPLAPSARFLLSNVDAVTIGRGDDRFVARTLEGGARRLVVRVPDRRMSASHAQISKVMGRWVIEDAGSKNGTFVNGAPRQRVVLTDGDLLELGHTLFLYRDAVPTGADDTDLDAARLAPLAPGLPRCRDRSAATSPTWRPWRARRCRWCCAARPAPARR